MANEKPEEDSNSPSGNGIIERIELRGAGGVTAKVTLTGGSSFFISWDFIASEDLYHGKELSPEAIDRIRQASKRQEACNKALRFLSLRDHSVFELREKLRNKGFPQDVIEQVLESLRREGVLSDERFAVNYLSSRIRRNPEGYAVLYSRLLQKGLNRETALKALEEVYTSEAERELLDRLYEKLTIKAPVPEEELIQRLQAKGFSYSRIREYLRERKDSDY